MSSSPSKQHQTVAKPIATGIIVHDATPEQKQPHLSWLSRALNFLKRQLLRGNEPRVWQKRNAAGQITYHCYDPHSGRSTYCDSEIEVMEWLDRLP